MENDDQAKNKCFGAKSICNMCVLILTSRKGVLKVKCVTCEASLNALCYIVQRLLAIETTLPIQPHSAMATVPLSEPNDVFDLQSQAPPIIAAPPIRSTLVYNTTDEKMDRQRRSRRYDCQLT